MGKKQRIRTGAGDVIPTPGPLHKQIEKSKLAKAKFKSPKQFREDEKHDKLVDAALSAKILKEAQKQWHEEKLGNHIEEIAKEGSNDESDQDDLEEEEFTNCAKELSEHIPQIESDEEAANDKVNTGESTLYDLIQRSKIKQKSAHANNIADGLDPTVVAFFTEIGQVMEKYRSGKVPKAFKIIPTMSNWEQIIELVCPERWSAAAMFQATRVFASTGTPLQCQRFNNLVLLPRLRDEIDEFKKLNFHMYQCLFKAMYKPAAFFKGILLPLCRSGTCTLREAIIFGSVLRKVSIPLLHAAAAMLSIAEMEYSGPISYILRILIEKNFTLPFRALDGLVYHFLRMRSYQGDLPVIWHQSFLAFVERYASDISEEQREALIELTKVKSHYEITPEIQNVLRKVESRNEESEANVPAYAREEMES